MKMNKKIIIITVLLALLFWVIESTLDTVFFSEKALLDEMILNPSAYEIYIRSLVSGFILIFGAIWSVIQERRKQSEQALVLSEEKYRSLVENTRDYIFLIDRDYRVLSVNQAAARSLRGEAKDIIGKSIFDLFPDYLAAAYTEKLKWVFETGLPSISDTEMVVGGVTSYINTSLSPVRNSDNEVVAVIGASRDITERKKAEEQISRLALMVDNSPNSVIIHDFEGNLFYANQKTFDLHGYAPDEFLALKLDQLDVPASRALISARMAELSAKGEAYFEVEHYRKDGTILPLSVSAIVTQWGDQQCILSIATDITERKKAEESLRESEQNFRSSLEGSPSAIIIVRSRGEVLFANRTTLDLFGYDDIEEMRSIPIERRYQPEQMAKIRERWDRMGRGEPVAGYGASEIIRKDGKVRQVEVFNTRITWNGKEAIELIYNDITERKQVEQQIERAAREWRETFDSISDMISIHDSDYRIRRVNKAFASAFNKTPQEIIGKHCYELVHGTDEPPAFCPHARSLKTKEAGSVEAFEPNLGKWLQISTSPIFGENGEVVATVHAAKDITERKNLEEEMIFRADMLDAAIDGIVVHDYDGNIIYANDAACLSYGYTREEFYRINLLDTITSYHNRKEINATLDEILEKGSLIFEPVIRRKDGTTFPVEVHARPTEMEGKQYILSIVHDITERKRLEAEQEQIRQKAMIASRLASVGEMAAGIAHEINNPLTGVIGFAELLTAKDLPEDIKEYVRVISEGSVRVADIVKRMLTFARQTKLERAPVDINEILRTTLEMRSSAMTSGNIQVKTELDTGLPQTTGDRGQLFQVFLNIIINAEKEMARAHGGGNLTVKTEKFNHSIRISFADDGSGIPEENIEKIFDPFFTTREVGEGTGLGLSLCHGIVTEHEGRIWAESEYGHGATFFVELPIVSNSQPVATATPAEKEEVKSVSPLKILIVEDEPLSQKYLTEVLTGEGHLTEIIDDGEQAIEKISGSDFDVVLLDIKLPGKSGIDIYNELNRRDKSAVKKIIFITGDVMAQDTTAFLSEVKTPYLPKPINTGQLKKAIADIAAAV